MVQNNKQGQEQEESSSGKPWWRWIIYFAIAFIIDGIFNLQFWGGVISGIIVLAIGELFLFNDDGDDIKQGEEQEEQGYSKWVYVALAIFAIFFARKCACSSNSSDSGSGSNKSEMVHKGLYDEGHSYGDICRSYGTSMTVDEAWDDMTYGHDEFPDGPTPEFIQGFKDGLQGK